MSLNESKKHVIGAKYNASKDWYLKEFGEVEEVSLPNGDKKETEIVLKSYKSSLKVELNQINKFCSEHKLNLESFYISIFGYLLSIYTMNKNSAFAYVKESFYPVLAKLEPNLKVVDYIKNVKDQLDNSISNNSYSFTELTSSSGYTTDVLFSLENVKPKEEHKLFVKLDSTNLEIEYQSNLYSEAWIKDFASRYQKLLVSFLSTTKLSDVSLISKEEEKEIIKVSYGGDLEYNEKETFIDIFSSFVKSQPNKDAVVDENSKYTYLELDKASNKIAHYLKEHKIQKGEFVAIKIRRIKEFFAGIIGINKIGAAYVPVDPAYPDDRIEYMVEDSKARIVLTEELIKEILSSDISESPINEMEIHLPTYMIYTSGSTGKPKGVVISQSALLNFIHWNIYDYNLTSKDVHAEHASFSFDASIVTIFPPLAVGSVVHIIGDDIRKDLDLTYQYLVDNKVTNACMSTQIGMSLINLHPDVPIKNLIVGGEKFLRTEKTKVTICNAYGPTEFTVCSSYQIVDQDDDKDVPIGKAVKNTYSFICDLSGNLLPLGMVGEICLAGPQLSNGYFNREELNKERFIDCKCLKGQKMYRTGDLARYNDKGELEYLGRIDFQVKLRGFRIELGEIENVASNYEGITQTIALVKNKLLVLYYCASKDIDENSLKEFMGKSLTDYMVPNVFMRLEKMPLNPSGKIDRKALPEISHEDKEVVKPRNESEKQIFDLLAKILGYSDFGVDEDFGAIGLTSISAMQLASVISTKMNKAIRVSDLVNHPTIASISEFISSKKEESTTYEIRDTYPLTMSQQGILTEVLAHPDTTIYNLPFVIDLPKDIDIKLFKDAINKVFDAHPYLKGRISSNESGEIFIKRNDEAKVEIKESNYSDLKGGVQSLVRPFDLLNEPFYRIHLLKDKDSYKLFFDAHHITFDGESLGVFMEDLNKAYSGESLTKEKYTEFEFALDEIKLHKGKELEEAKAHYSSLLEGRDIDCLLVADKSDKDIGKQELNLDIKCDRNKLESFINSNKLTVNGMWLSALGLAIAKYLDREDALFTTVYNGRNDVRVENNIGMFVHTLPVVADPYKYESSVEYVKAMGKQIQASMANDIYAFMEIARDFGFRSDIMFVYEGKIAQGFKLGNYDIPRLDTLELDEIKAPILIAIGDREDGFNIHLEYDGNKYESWSMSSFMKSFTLIFNQLLDNVNISDISLVDSNDSKEIDKYNATEVEIEQNDIVTRFNESVKKYPDNLAVICLDKKYTYKEVDDLSNKIAYYLASKGIGRGKVVSILIPRSEYMPITTLGVLKTGAAYQPLDHSYPNDRLQFMVKDADASLIIADRNLIDKLEGAKLPILYLDELDSLSDKKVELEGPKKDDLFILLYTSGTTGTPKGVMLTHLNLVNFCSWYKRFYNLKPGEVVSAFAGFGFDANMMDMYPALTSGATTCIVPDELRMNLDQLAKYYQDNKVSYSFMTTQVGRLFATENDKSSLKYLSVGGEKLTPLDPPSGYKLINGYGPTECTIFSTTQEVDKLYLRIPIGKPLDNYKLYVIDNKGHQLPNGALGELLISGLGVGKGYLNLKEKTEQSFIDNPFCKVEGYKKAYRTGDIVRRLADGRIDFIGRNDGQVKIRGFRIELGEVETAIRSFKGIKDVTVQAFDLEAGGKFLAAYFTSDKEINIKDIKNHIKANKPAYMVPASIMQIAEIPLNQNQKVNKRALPKPVFTDDSKEYVAPTNDIEKDICEGYSEILGIDKVSANESFFDIGGTSLTAAKVVIYASNKGYQISYQDVFAHPSAIELANYIKGNSSHEEVKKETKEEFKVERESLKYNDIEYVDDIKRERELGKVLLAGATGFLGIHIFKELLDQHIYTTILVRAKDIDPVERIKGLLMYYFDSPLDEEFDKYVKVINADITDSNLVNILKDVKIDTIINSAAIVKHFAADDSIERVNVGGVKNLIDVAEAKKARLIQVSTLSVAGENVDHKFPEDYKMKENQLYFGQCLDNKYVNSKFKAEDIILDAVEKDGLDAKIVRVGNLMSRQKDGEFQINSVTNAFMRSLKCYRVLEKFPISQLDKQTDFSPIDETAKTILLLATVPTKFTVFHSTNSHLVQMGDVIDAMNLAGFHIEKVNDKEFDIALKEAMQDEKKSMIVSSLLSYTSSDNLTHELIDCNSIYSVKALYRLGYRWPITDFEYLIKALESLDTLGFFDRDDM